MKKNYIITSAQYGARPHLPLLRSLRSYATINGAELLIIPMAGKNSQEDWLHPELQKHFILDGKKKLNNHIQAERYFVRPQQIDPVTGQGRFSASDISTIFESSKQRMKVVPNSVTNLPKMLMTTGAITRPNYNMNNRIGRIAEKDHVYGAVVVEVVDKNKYHFRHLRGNTRGQVIDLNGKYFPNGDVKPVGLEAMVLGDWHAGDLNPDVKTATFDMLETLQPKRIFIHDLFNGHSVSHHNERKLIIQATNHRDGRASLNDELKLCAQELKDIAETYDGEIYIVKSNHDEHLDRFIQEGRYLDHPINLRMGTKLAAEMVDGADPLIAGISMFYDIPDHVIFLTRTDEIKVWGYLLSAHGDKGANGARGSTRGMENAYGKSMSAHSHTPELFRDTVKVGTSTYLQLEYNEGFASSWMNTHGLIYEGGASQLVNIIEGEWRKKL